MKFKKLGLIGVLSISISQAARADITPFQGEPGVIVCSGTTTYGPAKITISTLQRKAIVSGAYLSRPQVFKNLTQKYGIMTAPGLAVYFLNAYGCLRNATILTTFRDSNSSDSGYVEVMKVGVCSGGRTSDDACGVSVPQEIK